MTSAYSYKTARVNLSDDGVLTVQLHSRGASLVWGALPHTELADLLGTACHDERLRVVVITGTGASFIELPAGDNTMLSRGGQRTGYASSKRVSG